MWIHRWVIQGSFGMMQTLGIFFCALCSLPMPWWWWWCRRRWCCYANRLLAALLVHREPFSFFFFLNFKKFLPIQNAFIVLRSMRFKICDQVVAVGHKNCTPPGNDTPKKKRSNRLCLLTKFSTQKKMLITWTNSRFVFILLIFPCVNGFPFQYTFQKFLKINFLDFFSIKTFFSF